MKQKLNSEVNEYIEKSEEFAKPILKYWRKLIFDTCPEVIEAIKWGIPHYDYKDDFMIVIVSYKNHCSFSFIKAELMNDPRLNEGKKLKPVQRFLGKITKLSELPKKEELIPLIQEAMALNEAGKKVTTPKKDKPKVLETPAYFTEQLKTNRKAKEIFESKSDSFRKDYIIWISDAKTEITRQKRIDESLEWIAEGKGRFWKYQK